MVTPCTESTADSAHRGGDARCRYARGLPISGLPASNVRRLPQCGLATARRGLTPCAEEPFQASVRRKARLQAQRLLKGRHAATGNRNLLVYAVERKKQGAARLRLNFLDQRKVNQVTAMNTEETVAIERFFQLS